MVSEPIASARPGRFDLAHIERVAQRLSEDLEHILSEVESNRGHASGIGYVSRRIEELSDLEVSLYLVGARNLALCSADWLYESLPFREDWTRTEEDAARSAVRKHHVCPEAIDQECAGAEGECFHRRHPEKAAFKGRLRKLNETLAKIRGFRVQLQDMEHSSDAASDFGYTWHSSGAWTEIQDFFRKLEYGRQGLDEEQRAALKRCKLESASLDRLINHARNSAYERRKRESDERFSKLLGGQK